MFVYPQNSDVESLTPNVMELGALGRYSQVSLKMGKHSEKCIIRVHVHVVRVALPMTHLDSMYSLLFLGYKPAWQATILNTVGNYNKTVSICLSTHRKKYSKVQYNCMRPPSYMWSAVCQNVIMHMTQIQNIRFYTLHVLYISCSEWFYI